MDDYDAEHADGFVGAMFEPTQSRNKNKHHWMYNEISLGELLRRVGFSEVYRCQYRKGRRPNVEVIDNRPDSLFMEGIK